MDLVIVAVVFLLFAVAMYVILDGFDLGVGILFSFTRSIDDRETMINSISPYWDGNETWLVMGGVALFSGFPLAYSVMLPALYLGVIVFLFALIFRGVVFEFRPRAHRQHRWDYAFAAASTVAAFAQGLVLGSFVQGFNVTGLRYVGGAFEWLTPFSVMTGIALVTGYALLGAGWLIIKTEGELQAWAYSMARPLTLGLLGFIVLVSIWTPLAEPDIARRWFTWPNTLYLAPVPIVTALTGWWLWRSLRTRRNDRLPFALSVALFMLAYLGIAISLWPYIVPRHFTFWEAASPRNSLAFILVGVLILLPLVLGYTVHTYRVFRGKTSAAHHFYH